MHPIRMVLIAAIVLILAYVIYSILPRHKTPVEPFSLPGSDTAPPSPIAEHDQLKSKYEKAPISIKGGIPDAYLNLPIREFIVKSSYNSAISGLYSSKEALKLILERGCRFIDFEIFSRQDVEYVSYSGDPEYNSMGTDNTSENRLKLADALNTTAGSAFSSPTPSTNDPLFILLRIKDNSAPIYKRIARHINNAFSQRLYRGTFNSGTRLRQLQGKVVIFLDILSSSKWNEYDKCDTNENECLDKVVALEAGTTNFPLYAYGDLLSLPTLIVNRNTRNLKTSINSFMIVQPPQFDAIKPPMPNNTIDKWHPQFLAYRFYQVGEELMEYEAIFNKYGCAFVPMSVFIADSNLKNAKQTDANNDTNK